jgi:WD40 repeat protein
MGMLWLAEALHHSVLAGDRELEAVARYCLSEWSQAPQLRLKHVIEPAAPITAIATAPQGKLVAALTAQGKVLLWSAASGATLEQPIEPTTPVTAVALAAPKGSGGQEILITGGRDGNLRLQTIGLGSPLTRPAHDTLEAPGSTGKPIARVAVCPNSTSVAAACEDGSIWLWDVAGRRLIPLKFVLDPSPVEVLDFSEAATLLAGRKDGSVLRWWFPDKEVREPAVRTKARRRATRPVDDGGDDSTFARSENRSSSSPVFAIARDPTPSSETYWSIHLDGSKYQYFISVKWKNNGCVGYNVNLTGGMPLIGLFGTWNAHPEGFSYSRHVIVSSSMNGNVSEVDLRWGEGALTRGEWCKWVFQRSMGTRAAGLVESGDSLVTWDQDDRIRIWKIVDLPAGRLACKRPPGVNGDSEGPDRIEMGGLAFSGDGTKLIAGNAIWRCDTGDIHLYPGPWSGSKSNSVNNFLNQDGSQAIVIRSRRGEATFPTLKGTRRKVHDWILGYTLGVWDLKTKAKVGLREVANEMLAYSGTTDTMLVGVEFGEASGRGSEVQFWNLRSLEKARPALTLPGSIQCVAVSPDGSTFAAANKNKLIRVWTGGGQSERDCVADKEVKQILFPRAGDRAIVALESGQAHGLDLKMGMLSSEPVVKQQLGGGDRASRLFPNFREAAVSPDGKLYFVLWTMM